MLFNIRLKPGASKIKEKPVQYILEKCEQIKGVVATLTDKVVMQECFTDLITYLHKVVLVAGREDEPAQSS